MNPAHIVYYSMVSIFTVGLAISVFIAYRRGQFSVPLTKRDVLRRTAMRLGFGTVLYLLLAWAWLIIRGDNVLFHGFWFWYAVVLIPGLGLLLDMWRLKSVSKFDDRDA